MGNTLKHLAYPRSATYWMRKIKETMTHLWAIEPDGKRCHELIREMVNRG